MPSHSGSQRPSSFTRSARKQTGRARRAFRENGPGHKLMDALGSDAYLFSLTVADLDSSLSDDPSGLYGDTVTALLAAVAAVFNGPVYAVAEVGKGRPGRRGKLHVHCVAHRDDGPAHVRRDSQRCTAVYDPLGLYRYLAKPPEPYSLAAELDAAAARVLSPSGRLPNTRRHLLSPERLAWVASTYSPIEPNPPQTYPNNPQTATAGTQGTPAPEDPSTPLSRPLSQHCTPSTSARTLKPSKPSQKRVVGEERTDSAVRQETRERCYRLVQLSSFESLGEFTNRARPEHRDEVEHQDPARGPPPEPPAPPKPSSRKEPP